MMPETKTTRRATGHPKPRGGSPGGQTPHPAIDQAETRLLLPGVVDGAGGQAARRGAAPNRLALFDPSLAFAADVLDDLERTKIANENRLRQLTRSATDADGEERGFGLDERHPDVATLAAIVEGLSKVEVQAVKALEKKMAAHPLGPWQKAQRGVGAKQLARLLAAIGDPYWNTLDDRPRTVSQLWAYCGYHVHPIGHRIGDAQIRAADGGKHPTSSQLLADAHTARAAGRGKPGDPGQTTYDAQACFAGVAAKRKKGERANWSANAKSRAFLIAESCVKAGKAPADGSRPNSPYYQMYADRKAHTEDRVHVVACVRCGPSGKPAAVGSPWSLAHRHADALRIVAKEILKGLWVEARRIHELPAGQTSNDAQAALAGRVQTSPGHPNPDTQNRSARGTNDASKRRAA